ncbi:hypothetical protein HYX18_00930 [Candidatus Woesearchaeota archaeon]|nr:hypothetical protein [Candidatus Woesearchaeota archaeon]
MKKQIKSLIFAFIAFLIVFEVLSIEQSSSIVNITSNNTQTPKPVPPNGGGSGGGGQLGISTKNETSLTNNTENATMPNCIGDSCITKNKTKEQYPQNVPNKNGYNNILLFIILFLILLFIILSSYKFFKYKKHKAKVRTKFKKF